MRWDYGDPRRGESHEYTNLFDALRTMPGVEARHLDCMQAQREGGDDEVRRRLLESVSDFEPHLVFSVLFDDEVPKDVLAELRDRRGLISFNWFCDDHWRFESFTRHYAPLFDACSTTATSALPKYARLRYDAVIKTQWAANPNLYRPVPGDPRAVVSFVGQPHGDRVEVISALRAAGLPVETRGTGWPEGRVEHEEMVRIFAWSHVNLNLANSSIAIDLRSRVRRKLGLRTSLSEQIKGRNFEIPACGGFQLSGRADDIESYFEPGVEIVVFDGTEELIHQAGRYLREDAERRRIAEAGLRRTLDQHTYHHRFASIFSTLGLPFRP